MAPQHALSRDIPALRPSRTIRPARPISLIPFHSVARPTFGFFILQSAFFIFFKNPNENAKFKALKRIKASFLFHPFGVPASAGAVTGSQLL